MKVSHHYHHSRFYSLIHSDFWNFEFSIWLHTLGRSLIAIFIPVLMLEFGYSLSLVIVYFIIFNLVDIPLNFLARRFTISLGARAVIILATSATIVYFALFGQLAEGGLFILITLAVLDAIYDSFYWVSHMYLFFESTKTPEEAGKNTGIINGVRSFAGMLGPGIGALFLLVGGRGMLLGVTILFLGLSILPLLQLHHIKNKPVVSKVSFREFFNSLREKKDYSEMFLNSGVWSVENILWPLFLFTVFGTLNSIVLVAVLISVGQIIFSYFTGLVSRSSGDKFIILGSVLTIATWILRLNYPNEVFYYASILLTGFFGIMIGVPIDSNMAERAHTRNSLDAATYRNVSTMIPPFILFVILALLTNIFKISFVWAIFSLLILVVANRMFLIKIRRESDLALIKHV